MSELVAFVERHWESFTNLTTFLCVTLFIAVLSRVSSRMR